MIGGLKHESRRLRSWLIFDVGRRKAHVMNITGRVVMLVAAIGIAGCHSQVAPAPSPSARIDRSSGATPFDADSKARAVYLEYLDYGYEMAKRGATMPAQEFQTEYEEARRQGYLDGIAKWKEENGKGPIRR